MSVYYVVGMGLGVGLWVVGVGELGSYGFVFMGFLLWLVNK